MQRIRIYGCRLILLASVVACASTPKPAAVAATPVPPPQTPEAVAVQLVPPPDSAPEARPESATTVEDSVTPAARPAKAKAKAHSAKGVDPEVALHWLENGNQRFVKHFLRKDGQSLKDVARLIAGQHPHTIVVSCSDSRVPPELIFDQKLGEIFVVRTAGESLDNSVIASIEYAVEHLGPHLILVMGHTYCGAVGAAVAADAHAASEGASPAMAALLADIRPRVELAASQNPNEGDQAHASWANAQGVAADLVKRSEVIRHAVESGEVVVHTALYNLQSGKVSLKGP